MDIENKFITTAVYNKFTKGIVANNIKSEKLVGKSTIAKLINNADLDKTVAILATKTELKVVQDKIIKSQAFTSSFFEGKSHFEDDDTQNYLVLEETYKYFKKISNTTPISLQKSKGLSYEIINPSATSDYSLSPALHYTVTKKGVKFMEIV